MKSYIYQRPGEPDCTWADISKAKKILKWQPQISLEQGVEKLLSQIDYWKEAPVWDSQSISGKKMFEYLSDEKNKIIALDELSALVSKYKKSGKKVVHCHGVFDLMHIGHIKHFSEAKNQGDILIVTLTPDEYVNKDQITCFLIQH